MSSTQIILPSDYDDFEFDKLTLESPISVPGNAFFTKILYKGTPVFIQTTTSKTKQGIVKTGKKYHADLVFNNTSESIIQWFENLENKCKQILFDKNNSWFQNPLTQEDIDNTFISIIKVYKSGKLYSIRTNIKTMEQQQQQTMQDISASILQPHVKIYNESYTPLSAEQITNETNINTLLEIKGIKFSSKNFQMEMELKQIMVLEEDKLIENFVIKKMENASFDTYNVGQNIDQKKVEEEPILEEFVKVEKVEEFVKVEEEEKEPILEELVKIEEQEQEEEEEEEKEPILEEIVIEEEKDEGEEEEVNINDIADSLEEIFLNEKENEKEDNDFEMDLEHSNEEISLKSKEDFYDELYDEVKKKAKEHKKRTIIKYLEEKKIKNTDILLIQNDDSDFEEDIE